MLAPRNRLKYSTVEHMHQMMRPLAFLLRMHVVIFAFALPGTAASQAEKSIRVKWEGIETFQNDYSYAGRNSATLGLANDYWHNITVKFVYIVDTDFKGHDHVVSHKISWVGAGAALANDYESTKCNGSNELELVGSTEQERSSKLQIPCQRKVFSNYFGFFPQPPNKIRVPKIVAWDKLRKDFSYSEEKTFPSGERYTYTVKASRIGTCAEHKAPIAGDDPDIVAGILHVDIDPAKGHPTNILPDAQTTVTIKVTCESVPVRDAKLEVKIDVEPNSGEHLGHPGDRPRGKLNKVHLTKEKPSIHDVQTGVDGKVDVDFKPGYGVGKGGEYGISGIYHITAAAERFPERKGSIAITAEVKDLHPLPAGANYVIDRGHTDTHKQGSHGTAATLAAIPLFANDFNAEQLRTKADLLKCKKDPWTKEPAKLSVNDIALPQGGLFDWNATRAPWAPPHQTHGEGKGVDFNHFRMENTVVNCDNFSRLLRVELTYMMLQNGLKYGQWDQWDLCNDPPKCSNFPQWHLHVNQK